MGSTTHRVRYSSCILSSFDYPSIIAQSGTRVKRDLLSLSKNKIVTFNRKITIRLCLYKVSFHKTCSHCPSDFIYCCCTCLHDEGIGVGGTIHVIFTNPLEPFCPADTPGKGLP